MLERFNRRHRAFPSFRIFATDVHPGSLRAAAEAVFDEAALQELTAQERESCMVEDGGSWSVAKRLRERVVVAPHDLLSDAPFTRLDLACCRNLLIYLRPDAQRRVLDTLRYALRPGGILFLGPSETISPGLGLETVDRTWKIFRNSGDSSVPPERIRTGVRRRRNALAAKAGRAGASTQLLEGYDALLARYAPPSILVNEKLEVLHVFGDAARFLRFTAGRPPSDVLDLLPEPMTIPVGTALRRALRDRATVTTAVPALVLDGDPIDVDVKIEHLATSGASQALLTLEGVPAAPVSETVVSMTSTATAQLEVLEDELVVARHRLQMALEEADTTNEELQSTNEELLASNEELQSTNEELQSVNEELYTVNGEYQRKIQELTQLRLDMGNILDSARIGVLFLDDELQLRRATPTAAGLLGLMAHDEGRPLVNLPHTLGRVDVADLAAEVLARQALVERDTAHAAGAMLVRGAPYRAGESVSGVVIQFVDISALAEARTRVRDATVALDDLYQNAPDMFCSVDAETAVVKKCNDTLIRKTGFSRSEIVGRPIFERYDPSCMDDVQRAFQAFVSTGTVENARLRLRTAGGEPLEVLLNVTAVRGPDGEVIESRSSWRDVTEVERARAELAAAEESLDVYRTLVEKMPVGATIGELADPDDIGSLTFLSVNRAGVEASGIPAEATVGKRLASFAGLMESELPAMYERALTTGENQELPLLRWDGQDGLGGGIFDVSAVPLSPRHLAIVYDDIGEVTRAREAAEAAREDLAARTASLERSNRELEQFAYIASHDLQEPLRMVGSYLQLLRAHLGADLDGTANEYIDVAMDGARRMSSLVDDVLRLSRLSSKDVDMTPVALGVSVDRALANLDRAVREAGVEVQVGELPTVPGHEAALAQLFQNLIGNAIKFRSDEAPRIRIEAEPAPQGWRVTVTDNGVGVPAEFANTVFEPFKRLHRRDEIDGNGIGLALVRRIVDQHGGSIHCRPAEPRGTTFEFTLRGADA